MPGKKGLGCPNSGEETNNPEPGKSGRLGAQPTGPLLLTVPKVGWRQGCDGILRWPLIPPLVTGLPLECTWDLRRKGFAHV